MMLQLVLDHYFWNFEKLTKLKESNLRPDKLTVEMHVLETTF